jgi:hypothetical protein
MQRQLTEFREFLLSLAQRPAMYIGSTDWRDASHFLRGYLLARPDLQTAFDGWIDWLGLRFEIWHPAWGWPEILRRAYPSDEEALVALPSLFDAYLADRERHGASGIAQMRKARFLERFGVEYHAPED